MELVMIGLGKMGANMTSRLLKGGHRVVAYDLNEDAIKLAEKEGAAPAYSLEEVKAKLAQPRVL